MAVQYIFGSAGAGKSYELLKRIKGLAKKEPRTKFLVIVPEQFTLQTQKDFVTLSDTDRGIMNIDVLSFLRLAYRVFEETGGADRIVLEDTGKSMIVKKVAMQHEKELLVFGRNVHKAGFIAEVKSIISEFYQYDIGAEELEQMQQAAENNVALSKKLSDLALLYRGFQDFLADRYITTEGILSLLGERAES
ncbi:MAG: helicase-exonuclease AddAB subunit AddB, partial [Lachnospiraceae bacterium]|nr:helicase-exonuclease AddAB subunit AddB [Lachnospiraceae bacterium]